MRELTGVVSAALRARVSRFGLAAFPVVFPVSVFTVLSNRLDSKLKR